jgi:ATP-dependent Clp protease ATP-binding subunit ClpA
MSFWRGLSMPDDVSITVFYGPLSWFNQELSKIKYKALLDVVYEHDDENREQVVIHVQPGQDGGITRPKVERAKEPRIKHLAAESGDFANLNDHVITNFPSLVRRLNPRRLYLHNPPIHVHKQLERSFAGELTVQRYPYPAITRETLIEFRDHFSDHLVGPAVVKEALLTAMYPLTRPGRDKPVVLMFYGPSGVGKTESSQFINGLLGGTLMRKQFSMFHSDQFASYVFGGRHSEPSFAHDLLDRESGVILIDEFDKANSVFHSAFYQLFDGGVFEDKNYSVEVGPSLIICTSNYGTEEEIRQALGEALYSRFDALIQFKPLAQDEIRQVIDRLVEGRYRKLGAEEQTRLSVGDIKAKLYARAHNLGNVRKLGKLVDEVISLVLVRAVLSEVPIADEQPRAEGAP